MVQELEYVKASIVRCSAISDKNGNMINCFMLLLGLGNGKTPEFNFYDVKSSSSFQNSNFAEKNGILCQ